MLLNFKDLGCVVDFNVKDNFIRKANSDNSPSIGYEYSEESVTFSISEIKGDWIKIECVDFCDTPCKFEEKYNGWIKWKKGNDLLIRLLYAC